jgi:hypothetical protein
VAFAGTVDHDHIGMADAREHLRLAQKCLGAFRRRELGPQHLDRDRPVEHHLVGEIDAPHAAAGELSLDAVVRRDCLLQAFQQGIGIVDIGPLRPQVTSAGGAWAALVRA